MAAYNFPSAPDENFKEFLRKSEKIEGERLQAAIPRDYFEPRVARGILGFAVSWALYIGAIAGVALAPHWLLWIPLWIVAGLGGWGLHCIAHDCGHGSFSRSRKFNFAVGHVSLLPLIYPFHAWRHVHNLHHSHTNNLELDTDWRPVPAALYDRMPFHEKVIYHGTRTWAFWGGTINYWRESGFRPGYFPKREARRDVRRSMVFVLAVCVLYFTPLIWFTGVTGFLIYFVAPWLATHAWFSATTLMHHSSSDVPYLTNEHWTRNASRLLVTTDYVYPKWLLFLTHNISIHTAHHVAPVVPYYNLRKAQAALKAAYPGMVREEKVKISQLARIVRRLHFYDTESGYYTDFSRTRIAPADAEPVPVKTS
ncbi:fatty acid desaturase [Streptomyces albireticuli]|uniref:Fatty acid desaturase n=1 Tax=Streptomyces albireticuli TaxID=1940 RepID=A0A2A2D9U2_9ACTN|nr:fatty acid desaturase [Streptomyces albireticuli]MCD9141025.1 fatty acid desaturase [Streptomyces albireticuli]MCD9161013.1 fatty acid desaturase [Streptomyces albireticuli]MCD9190929.1 fatty acid desaturase [Streptomyces albireticuli]PAU49238.1 fatty acid desaturase [Streptomyces albireticuli]